jgi:hypothetical protein
MGGTIAQKPADGTKRFFGLPAAVQRTVQREQCAWLVRREMKIKNVGRFFLVRARGCAYVRLTPH